MEEVLETCAGCSKKMIPSVVMGQPKSVKLPAAVPLRSVCPFCGTTFKDFPPSAEEQEAKVVKGIVVAGMILVFIWMLLGVRR